MKLKDDKRRLIIKGKEGKDYRRTRRGYTLLVRRFASPKVQESEGSLVRRFVS